MLVRIWQRSHLDSCCCHVAPLLTGVASCVAISMLEFDSGGVDVYCLSACGSDTGR